jgi:hypothetical protein
VGLVLLLCVAVGVMLLVVLCMLWHICHGDAVQHHLLQCVIQPLSYQQVNQGR